MNEYINLSLENIDKELFPEIVTQIENLVFEKCGKDNIM